MNISIVSVFPELYQPFFSTSLLKRVQEKGIISFDVADYFSFVAPKERIDAPSFGPGAGMLLRPEVVQKAIESQEGKFGKSFKIFFSPQGKKVDQSLLKTLAPTLMQQKHIMLMPARYEGMDSRVEEHYADLVLSVGDFVVMGGDIPAMLFLEGMLRLIPDVVGKQESVERDSFMGPFVDYPEYTEPLEWQGMKVPEIIRSGHHAAIEQWRQEQAAQKTVLHHFDWLRSKVATQEQKKLAERFIPAHYAALMHSDVVLGPEQVGASSVTSIDIHDGSRSCKTYGLKNYFIVTPLKDQQAIVRTLLDFWHGSQGQDYNPSRAKAVKQVELVSTLDEVLAAIEKKEGKKPLLIATSAKRTDGRLVHYFDQEKVWAQSRPILLLFGTAKGLSKAVLDRCDYILGPIEGFSDFNHLSVRSAMAVVLDRWLGINIKE
ncbi:MAG: tRNA (guanosine(37)-N1)-methyltransferase TrmD [Candidatus Babeliales bacterium]